MTRSVRRRRTTRADHAQIPPRVEEEISQLGRTLAPVFATLVRWSDARLTEVDAARRDGDGAERHGRDPS